MLNPIKEIYNWQVAAGNAARPYDDFLESSFQIEEAIEGFDLAKLCKIINFKEPDTKPAKHISRYIVESCVTELSDLERLDKACDAIVFAIGSMAKLGLDHHGITKALNIVNTANKQKINAKRDEQGKLLKPDNFIEPEEQLQVLLNSVRNNK